MKLRRIVSCMMALLLVCSLTVTAFAAEYDLALGSVIVNATESGQTVTHGSNAAVPDSAPVITQSTAITTNTITINAAENATANVTIQDVNIVISDPAGAPQDHSGQAAVSIVVAENAEANVTLDGVNIDVGGTGGYDDYQNKDFSGEAAVQITGNGNVAMELDGDNTVQSGYMRSGVEKNAIAATDTEPGSGNGKFTITDENETQGSLEATGGVAGAGIGGGFAESGSNIEITGSAVVTAQGGDWASGIGGGDSGSGSNITISGTAEVIAQGGIGSAGIGGGNKGIGSSITITGSAEVTAKGGYLGAGIGGGSGSGSGSGRDITVSQDAQVKAQGGNIAGVWGAGAAIGNGGAYNQAGQDVTPNTDDLNEGWVATYAPGTTDMKTATPNRLTYKDANGTVTTANQNITIEAAVSATSDTHGHEAGYKVGDKLVAVTTHYYDNYVSNDDATCTKNGTETGKCSVPGCTAEHTKMAPNSKLDHEFGEYVPDADNLATCTKAGTKTAMCKHCTATDTVPDPIKDHSFTNYISDGNATYDHDGTKTAKCDHCDATDTIPDPGSKLVREETAQTAPLYRVIGQDGKAISCKAEQSSGVLTITVDADFATLTGSTSGLKTLKAQGIDTIVFVTNGATSTFALADLLASMTAGDSYSLTHDGDKVTFTLSSGEDIGKILK